MNKKEICLAIARAYRKKAKDNEGVVEEKTVMIPIILQRGYYTSAIRMPYAISEDLGVRYLEKARKFENLSRSRFLFLKTKSSLDKILAEF